MNWKHRVFVFITEIFWQTFWCSNWRSIFDVLKRLYYRNHFKGILRNLFLGPFHLFLNTPKIIGMYFYLFQVLSVLVLMVTLETRWQLADKQEILGLMYKTLGLLACPDSRGQFQITLLVSFFKKGNTFYYKTIHLRLKSFQ